MPRLGGRSAFSEETFAGRCSGERDAPFADPGGPNAAGSSRPTAVFRFRRPQCRPMPPKPTFAEATRPPRLSRRCEHQNSAPLSVHLPQYPGTGASWGRSPQSGSRFPLFSATRKMTECPEYRHIVPGHPPLCDLSAFNTEHCPEIKLRPSTRRWKWAHRSLLRALIRGPRGDEIALGN